MMMMKQWKLQAQQMETTQSDLPGEAVEGRRWKNDDNDKTFIL